ncbi:GNAT family N-acetyltransferase [Chondrinema litorale]|uniref:GNAT family N-acetyltransferase n=1 Tax=Chondrinema litorale TaxID=2994555 RepID=UPI0025427F4C|nr:GNAT family N-acetyltransferase [Chondrinema litorale]UZR99710.1 GNAT family N-acetyltransferase [Chondrinema litorale]
MTSKNSFHITLAESTKDLEQILALQQKNHFQNISSEVKDQEGFVTVVHNLELLTSMNSTAKQVIAKDGDEVVGYALVMTEAFQDLIPVLKPMFEMFKDIDFKGKKVTEYTYYVMGQICVAEGYRGSGVFSKMYAKHKEVYASQFDLCITEVSTSNKRSMRAHEKVGFVTVHTNADEFDEWNILVWDWE